MVTLQTKEEELSAQLINLDNKREDLEARSRRNNIRILGVPEDSTNSSTTAAASALLKEAFKLDEESLLDRARLSLQPKPKPSASSLHYHTDCVNILRRARAQQRIRIRDVVISVFPDLTVKTACAHTSFTLHFKFPQVNGYLCCCEVCELEH